MNILIIGATSAVAQKYASICSKRGDQLFLVARNSDKLATVCQGLGTAVVGSKSYDFTDVHLAQGTIDEALQKLEHIDIALFAHGLLPEQVDTERDVELMAQVFSVNLVSVIALLNPLHKALQSQSKSSKIAVITSVAGDRGRPRNFAYGAAKGGLGLYLEGLRSKYLRSGVALYNVKLGPTDTPMTVSHEKNGTFITAEKAATLIDKGLKGQRYTLYVPGFWRWIMLVVKLMPEWLFQRLKFLSAP
jgi:decaprenylphospho-beta-D-erythro-pentofuranosid-2-ulose 2-reductase